jgi:hypothetical protein
MNAVRKFRVLPDMLLELPGILPVLAGAPRHLVSTPGRVTGTPRCSQIHLQVTASVLYPLGFDHCGILVRQLIDSPGTSQ